VWLRHAITLIYTYYMMLFQGSRVNVFPGCALWLWLTRDQCHLTGISCKTPWLLPQCAFLYFVQNKHIFTIFCDYLLFTQSLSPTPRKLQYVVVKHMFTRLNDFLFKKFAISVILVMNFYCIKLISLLQWYSFNGNNFTYR